MSIESQKPGQPRVFIELGTNDLGTESIRVVGANLPPDTRVVMLNQHTTQSVDADVRVLKVEKPSVDRIFERIEQLAMQLDKADIQALKELARQLVHEGPLNAKPGEYGFCPLCGDDDGPFVGAATVTAFDDGVVQDGADGRLVCQSCSEAIPITTELANEIECNVTNE